jgi:phytoene/squalene synthetase
MSIKLFDDTSIAMSRKLALNYSTSFSLGIRLLSKDNRWAVFSIYGLVRVADEIVDTKPSKRVSVPIPFCMPFNWQRISLALAKI